MMIVVPSFAEGDQRDQKIVATVIFGGITSPAETMRQRIDQECSVVDEDCADKEAPYRHLSCGSIHTRSDNPQQSSESQHEDG